MPSPIGPIGGHGSPLVSILTSKLKQLEGRIFVDTSVIASVTTLTSNEAGPYYDSATPASITSIPTGEFEFLHPTGQWGPFDDDDGFIGILPEAPTELSPSASIKVMMPRLKLGGL